MSFNQSGNKHNSGAKRLRFVLASGALCAIIFFVALPAFRSHVHQNSQTSANTPDSQSSQSQSTPTLLADNSVLPTQTPDDTPKAEETKTPSDDSEAAKGEEHIDKWVLRRAKYDISPSIVDGSPFQFHPFPDVDYGVHPTNTYFIGSDSHSAVGPILDEKGKEIGMATIIRTDGPLGVGYAGHFQFQDGRLFTLRHNAKGEVVIDELDENGFPQEAGHPTAPGAHVDHHSPEELENQGARGHHGGHDHHTHGGENHDHHAHAADETPTDATIPTPDTGGTTVASDGTALRDGETEVTMAVAFSASAQTAWGGDSAIRSQIALGIQLANTGYRNSNVNMQLRLVYAAQVANGPGDFTDDLYKLSANNDGVMDEVHNWRNAYGADTVALINNKTEYCGIGWMGPADNYMFTVTYVGCIATYTMAHELGHNFGCAHDRQNQTSGRYSYSFGSRFYVNGVQYRSIMAYAPGSRVNYFSSPTAYYQGVATGTATEDNARTLNNGISTVAAYRSSFFTISGRVTLNGAGVSGVSINGGGLGTTTTDSSGNYVFSNVASGTAYTITPSMTGSTFSPANATGTLSASVTKNFTQLKPPTLASISASTVSKNATSATVSLSASDPTGGTATLSASISRVDAYLYTLDQTHNLWTYNNSFSLNALGQSEKWIRGQSGSLTWFYILPSGALYQWGGSAANSTLIARLPTSFYTDPTTMYDRTAPSSSAKPTVSISGTTLTISNPSTIQGDFNITVTATTSYGSARQIFLFQVKNIAPDLASITNVALAKSASSTNVSLSATDPDGDSITYGASVDISNDATLYSLDQNHDLAMNGTSYSLNSLGLGEKWIRGQAGAKTWFYVTPAGALYQWGGSVGASTLVITVPKVYFTDPTLFFDRRAAQPSNVPSVSVSGSTLTVTKNGYLGPITINATASDGALSDTESFVVTTINNAPVLNSVTDIYIGRSTNTGAVTLSATDADNDSLTYSGTVDVSNDAALYTLDQAHDWAKNGSSYSLNAVGLQEKWFRGQLGARTWFYILPDGKIYLWGGTVPSSTLSVTVPTVYYRDPTLLFDRRAAQPGKTPTISASGSTLTIERNGYVGVFVVNARVSDGYLKDDENFAVAVVNSAPTFTAPTNQSIGNSSTASVSVTATDPENDTLTRTATIDVSYDGTLFTLDQQNDLGYNNGQVVYNSLGIQEKWLRGQTGARTWYYILPDGKLYRWGTSVNTSVLVATLPVMFYTDPTLLFNRLAAQSGHTPTASWIGGTVSITPNGYVGAFSIRLSAADGEFTTTKSFQVTAVSADMDGDGISNEDEERDGTDPDDASSQLRSLTGPGDVMWDSRNEFTQVLEFTNPTDEDAEVVVRLNVSGATDSSAQHILVSAYNAVQVPTDSLPGFVLNAFGVIHIERSTPVDARVLHKRIRNGSLESTFALPFTSPLLKRGVVSWNTKQPSNNTVDASNVVTNSLYLANLEDDSKSFLVYNHLDDGTEMTELEMTVPGHGVLLADSPALMLIANQSGSLTIRPSDLTAKYLAQVLHTGLAADSQRHVFDYALPARIASDRPLSLALSTHLGADDVIALTNILDQTIQVQAAWSNLNGAASSSALTIPASGTLRLNAASYVNNLNTASFVTFTSDTTGSLAASRTSYFRTSAGGIRALTSDYAEEALEQHSANTFDFRKGVQNRLTISNPSDEAIDGVISVHGNTRDMSQDFHLEAHQSMDVQLDSSEIWNLSAEEHGTISVDVSEGGIQTNMVKLQILNHLLTYLDTTFGPGTAACFAPQVAQAPIAPPKKEVKKPAKKKKAKKTKAKKKQQAKTRNSK